MVGRPVVYDALDGRPQRAARLRRVAADDAVDGSVACRHLAGNPPDTLAGRYAAELLPHVLPVLRHHRPDCARSGRPPCRNPGSEKAPAGTLSSMSDPSLRIRPM